MPESIANTLDISLALKRTKLDIPRRVFVRNPHELALIEVDEAGWLTALKEKIDRGEYYPSANTICDVPKGNHLIRPGSNLSLEDRVVYAACVETFFENLYRVLSPSQNVIDYSYLLANTPNKVEWLTNQFIGWKNFREKSIKKIDEGMPFVVITDISGYYDNIDIALLMSDIRNLGASNDVVGLLSKCLNKWAMTSGRGIPQGYTPSDILGKLYLNSVDQNLKNQGYFHYRYVDDIRIFCSSLREAKKAIVALTQLLRMRGLLLQSAKTKIYCGAEAKSIINGVSSVIQSVHKKYIDDASAQTGEDNPYLSMIEAEKILAENPKETMSQGALK